MRVYGLANDLGLVSLVDLRENIGKGLIKVQHMMVKDRIIERENFVVNATLDSLILEMSKTSSYIECYEEEDGYTLRVVENDVWGCNATEYKILEVL